MTTFTQTKNLLTRFSIPKAKHWKAIFGKIDEIEANGGSGGGGTTLSAGEFKVLADIASLADVETVLTGETPADSNDPVYLANVNGSLCLILSDGAVETGGRKGNAAGYALVYQASTPTGAGGYNFRVDVEAESGTLVRDDVYYEYRSADLPETVRVIEFDQWTLDIGTNVLVGNTYKFNAYSLGSDTAFQVNNVTDDVLDPIKCFGGEFRQVSGTNSTLTIPNIENTYGYPNHNIQGRATNVTILNTTNSTLTIVPDSGVTINSNGSLIIPANSSAELTWTGVEVWNLFNPSTESGVKYTETQTSLGAFNSESGNYDASTRFTIIPSAGNGKLIWVDKVFVSIQLDSGYTIDSTAHLGMLDLEIYHNGESRIGSYLINQANIVFTPNNAQTIEIVIDYTNDLYNWINEPVEFAISGQGIPTTTEQMHVKVSTYYREVDTFDKIIV